MKRVLLTLVAIVILSVPSQALAGADNLQQGQTEAIYLSTKVPVALYGFISAEGMYSDSQISTFGTLNNVPANYNKNMSGFNRVVDEATATNNDAFISASVQNTRFGFNLDPYNFGGKSFSVDARIEMDFLSTTNMNISAVVPRIRRAYAGIGQERWHVLCGQEWDVFSPLNTATLNIGGNLWLQGNQGFRRPQFQFMYNHPIGENGKIEGGMSINLPSNSMSFDDNGNTTGIPMFEGRIGYLHKLNAGTLKAYLSALYARHKNAVAGAAKVNNWGIALSLEAPIHKFFMPSFEFQYGYSLGAVFSIASDINRERTISGWGQIKSLWLSWLETNVGYGFDTLKSSEVPATFVKRNQTGFGNIMFKPVPAFAIGLEYDYLRTTYQGTGTSEANAGLLNILYFF
jgi:hypothetical protein